MCKMGRTVQKGSFFANRCVVLCIMIILTGKQWRDVSFKRTEILIQMLVLYFRCILKSPRVQNV